MSSNMVMWILAWVLIIFVIRFRLTTRPLRGSASKSISVNPESLKFLQQYWSSQLPVCARKVADVESYLYDLLPENNQGHNILQKYLDAPTEEITQLHLLAEKNPGQAEYILSLIYKGVFTENKIDETQSRKWLSSAAENGHAVAMFDLGQQEIIETMRDENTNTWQIAIAYFTRAAEKNLPEARFMIANALMANNNEHFSREEILEVMAQAAAMNHPVANFIMALAHLIDDSLLLDREKSREYFATINELEYPSGQTYYAELILGAEVFTRDHVLAFQLLQDAYNNGFISAGIPLGRMYELGDVPESEQDKYKGQAALKKSLTLYRKAAIQGNCQAFLHMIRLYQRGVPAPDYDSELNYWFKFEAAETNKSHLAVHFYLAWTFVHQYQSHNRACSVIEKLLQTLHIPFEDFDFDEAYQSIRKSPIDTNYSGFLQWLVSDFCESVGRKEQFVLLEQAARQGLRVAQLVSIDPHSALDIKFDVPDQSIVMQTQASLGCGVACFEMFNSLMSAGSQYEQAMSWLEAAVKAMNVDALLRIAALKLQRFDYGDHDSKLLGMVEPDTAQAIVYLQQAAAASQQAAYLLKHLYLCRKDGPDLEKARYYHRYAIINFGDEEQYVQSFIKSLVRVESL